MDKPAYLTDAQWAESRSTKASRRTGSNGQRGAKAPAGESLVMKRASSVAPEAIPWLWRERFPHRRLSVLTGPPGLGKSQITAFLAATVTADKSWPDGSSCVVSGPVIILSAEDDPADTIVPRLIAAGADLNKVIIVEAIRAVPEGGNATERCFDLSRDIDHLQELCSAEKAVLVIVDPVSAYLGGGVDGHSNTDVRRVLAPLATLAAKCRTAVVAVTHDRKSGGPAGERTLGSIAFIAAPRAVWAVTPEAGEDGEPTGRNIFTRIKGNLGPDPGGLAYEIEPYRVSAENEPDGIGTSRVKWCQGAIMKTADQLYAAQADLGGKNRKTPERDSAEEFLRELLAEGMRPAEEIMDEAKAAGFAPATIRRARETIGIKPRKPGLQAGWIWELPSEGAHQVPSLKEHKHLRRCSRLFEDAHDLKDKKDMSIFGSDEEWGLD
jgi:putative DNA primase/helicase